MEFTMLDFSKVRNHEITFGELTEGLAAEDLRSLTNEMIDEVIRLMAGSEDEDVVFVPQDPEANDPYAATAEEIHMPWTLGHVIVHITASSEESAFLAAELARGVPRRRARSRYEVHWKSMKTIEQCFHRLEESRRMQLSCLEVWPDQPHMDNGYESRFGMWVDPVVQFIFGLSHADSHLGQIQDIVQQAKAARL
jgi:hypothetical protein